MIENIEYFEKSETKKKLLEYQIPLNWLGFKYLVTAIPYVIDKIQSNEKVVMGELYLFIGEKYKTSGSNVERVIRYVCKQMENGNVKKIECKKLTNQTLIVDLAMSLMEKFDL